MSNKAQTWQELAEELRMEIEQWQNPIFETMMGPLPQNITDPILEEAYSQEHLLENPYQVLNENVTEQIEKEFKTNENDSKP
jgi:hypothetical protein